jgi:hypothetical protein
MENEEGGVLIADRGWERGREACQGRIAEGRFKNEEEGSGGGYSWEKGRRVYDMEEWQLD